MILRQLGFVAYLKMFTWNTRVLGSKAINIGSVVKIRKAFRSTYTYSMFFARRIDVKIHARVVLSDTKIGSKNLGWSSCPPDEIEQSFY